ncbi:hypothetical protein MBANPS3_011021 [Mucor bainieri]
MADPFRVEPKGKSWADIVEEDEQSDLLNSQHEENPSASKEESNEEESDAALQDAASAPPSSDQQADSSSSNEQPPKAQDSPVLIGSRASKWASAPSEPREPSKWQSTSAPKAGSMASKWANAPDSPSRSRYDSSRHDSYSRFGGNEDRHGRNTDLPRNNRWREDPPSGGRLNRSAFEDEDARNGGFNNKANFSKEKRHQEYRELTSQEAVKDEAPEHKKAIEGWNAYKPPAEEDEETAKQLAKAANEVEQTTADQTAKEEQHEVPIVQKEESKEIEVSPTKAVEPVKPAVSSSPSLQPVSSFSWADDIPDSNSDDDSDYPIPADWITPKVTTQADTTKVQEASATPQAAENDIAEPATDDLSSKPDPGAAADAKNSPPEQVNSESTRDTDLVDGTAAVLSETTAPTSPPTEAPREETPTFTWGALDDYKEPVIAEPSNADTAALTDRLPEKPEEPAQPAWADESATITTSNEATPASVPSPPAQAPKEEAPIYTWGALNDYKEPEVVAPKPEEMVKMDKEQEEAAVAAWSSVKLPEEPEEEATVSTAKEEKPSTEEQPSWDQSVEQEKPSWSQPEEEKPSWNQSAVSSWDQAEKGQPSDATEVKPQQEPVPEPKPAYTWGALDDYKEPEVVAPKSEEIVKIGKEQEEAAVAAWNSVKLPEESEEEATVGTAKEEKPSTEEQPSWNQSVEQEKPSWSQPEEDKPSWNQSAVSSWDQAEKEQPSDATEVKQQQEPVPEPKPAYTWGALDDYKEPDVIAPKPEEMVKMDKEQEEAAVAAWSSAKLPEEPEEQATIGTTKEEKLPTSQPTIEQPSWNQSVEQEKPSWGQPEEEKPSWSQSAASSWDQADKEQPSGATEAKPQQEPVSEPKPTYVWGALNDYKEPEIVAPKSEEVVKMGKEEEEAAVAAWSSAKLPEEPETKADTTTIEDKKPSWSQVTEEQPLWSQNIEQEKPSWNEANEEKPSWNQSTEPSWNQPTETSWNQPEKEQPNAQQQELVPESKPTYTWGALNDYKEPEVVAQPKPDIADISKEDEKAAISAWNSVKLPEVPSELNEDKSQEPVHDTPAWSSAAQTPEPVKEESSWNATSRDPTWNTDSQATSWDAVEQPSWSDPSATAESNTAQQQDWSANSFQEGSSVTSKSSFKDTWKNKLPATVDDNAGGWKSFAETIAAPPVPAPKQPEQKPADTAAAITPRESTLKRTEKGSAASKWSHDRYNGAELIHPRPSQKKPHDLSFKLNDFKEAANNEVHVSWKDIQAQDSPKISIKDDTSGRQVTVGLSEFSRANPELRLSDVTAGRPLNNTAQQQQQQQHQGPQEVILSFSEFNKGRDGANSTFTPPTASISNGPTSSSSAPKDIVCKLSDFGRKDKADAPLDITLKLF